MGKVVEFRESPGPSGPIFWYLDKGLPWIDAHTLIVSLGVPADEMGQLMLSRTCKEDRGMAEEGELPSGESVGSRPVLSLIGAIAVTCDKSAPNFQAVHDWLSETFLPAGEQGVPLPPGGAVRDRRVRAGGRVPSV